MNKIRSIQFLKAEKKRLHQRRKELEKAIRYDWRDVKDSLRPASLTEEALKQFLHTEKNEEKHTLADILAAVAAAFTKNAIETAAEKIIRWMQEKKE
ncbi:MAG: hypothetical protein K2Q24_18470 [Chitinophagaceae bacterium]|nr:hypothetical protein [Chitinophagaceae bacterium]